jgi:hypothetical protein
MGKAQAPVIYVIVKQVHQINLLLLIRFKKSIFEALLIYQ